MPAAILKALPKYRPDSIIKEIHTDEDHVHILVSIPPTVTVGGVVRLIKANTARSLKAKFPHLKQVYWGTDSMWSAGYFASTVGINEETIRRYIETQGLDDAGQTSVTLV